MDFGTMWSRRAAARGQAGFSAMGVLMAAGSTATVAGMLVVNGGDPVAAAEQNACAYDQRIVLTAIEADHLTDDSLDYATPAGPDGLDEVRASGYLLSESKYWRFEGLGPDGQPVLVPRQVIEGCA